MKTTIIALALVEVVRSQVAAYGQCGGSGWTGGTTCCPGYTCTYNNAYYSQCTPIPVPAGVVGPYGQCGGQGYTGMTQCSPGYTCTFNNNYYSQCTPVPCPGPQTTAGTSTTTTKPTTSPTPGTTLSTSTTPTSKPTSTTTGSSTSTKPTSSSASTTSPSSTSTTSRSSSSTSSSSSSTSSTTLPNCSSVSTPPASAGKVRYSGVNIAGFDFGCSTDGTCNIGGSYGPIGPARNRPDGPGQMQHFTSDGFNAFRLPVGWQYLINSNNAGSTLDANNAGDYDILVQACLATGALCVIDIHNYARFNGAVINSGGPSKDVFAAFWGNIAAKYKNSNVAFGVVNEPHDMPSISAWVDTVQAVVTAIRKAGATSQMILMPGTGYSSAAELVSSGFADALLAVSNPDGSKTGLVFDVHKYLDADNSGSGGDCVSNYISQAFSPLAQYLRCHGRQAFLTETGGIESSNCYTYVCQAVSFLNANSDVYIGYLGWAAGSFDTNYALSETPNGNTDQQLVTQCLKPK